MSKRLNKIAELIYQCTSERMNIANLKDVQQSKLWETSPTKHQAIYDEYESLIKKHSYLLADLEAELEKLRPKSRKLQAQVNDLVEIDRERRNG